MELVRRYTEINRSAKEEAANGDDRREKSWFTKKGSSVLLRTKMAMRKRREQGERAPQSTFPSRGARVSVETRDSHPGWTTDGGLVRRGHLPAESKPPFVPQCLCPVYWHRARSGAPEDAPGDPTPFQPSALLQHSRVMLLDLGDPRGWLYSGHAGKTAATDGVTKGFAYIAIYRALMINRQIRAASRGFNDCKLEGYDWCEHLCI